jgi:hypothetical protein
MRYVVAALFFAASGCGVLPGGPGGGGGDSGDGGPGGRGSGGVGTLPAGSLPVGTKKTPPALVPGGGIDGATACGAAARTTSGTLTIGDGVVIAADARYTLPLAGSGDVTQLLLPLGNAREPGDPLTPSLSVRVPNAQCPHLMSRISPTVAVPHDSPIRAIEGYFNGQRLPLDNVYGQAPDRELIDEAHNFGPQMMPFNTPLFSLAGLPSGKGTLEIRGYDADYAEIAVWKMADLEIVAPPAAVATARIAALPHPRVLLTPERVARAAAKLAAGDAQARRYAAALDRFLAALDANPDATSEAFASALYNPASYLPALGLCYQVYRQSDPTRANRCASAARGLALQIATNYGGADAEQKFSRDTGYDIRDQEQWMLLALDWIHDVFSDDERQKIIKVGTAWVDWYTTSDGAYSRSRPANNYFSPFLEALMLTGIVTAGENPAAERELTTLRQKLGTVQPIANQRACGGDWPEGGNYGPNTLRAYLMVKIAMQDIGEDWSAVFDFLQPLGQLFRYAMTADHTQMLPFGGFSGIMPHKTSPALLAMLTDSTRTGAHAAALYSQALATANNDLVDAAEGDTSYELIFGDAVAPAAPVDGMALSCLSSGSGRFFSKSSLDDPNAYLVTAENMHYFFDHFGYANGDVRFFHGGTCLVCPSTYRGFAFNGEDVTDAFSTYQLNGKMQSNDRNNQMVLAREGQGWSAIGMRFESSFAGDRYDETIFDPAGPLDYMIRETVHVRPDVMVVRDLHRRRRDGDSLVARFHLGPGDEPSAIGDGRWQVGPLTVSLQSTLAPATTFVNDLDQQSNLVGKQLLLTFPSSTEPVEVVTVFSDTSVSLVSYAGGVARLSNGKCVTFANGDVDVSACP